MGRSSMKKTAFDSSGLGLSEYVEKFNPNVIDNVAGRVKGHFFLISVIARFTGQSSLIKLK